jgi:hypothetical protein
MDGMKTWQAVVTDLGYIASVTFLAYMHIISGDAVLVALGVVGGAMGARRLARKKGQSIPPSAVTGLWTGITPGGAKR